MPASVKSNELYFGNFNCSDNNLNDLIGAPKFIEEDVRFESNNIKSLKGLEYVGGTIRFDNNPIEKILGRIINLKEKLNRVIEVFNEYDIDCDSDEDYIEQLFADYGIKYKIYKP